MSGVCYALQYASGCWWIQSNVDDMRVSTSIWLDECGAFDPEKFPIIMHRALSPAPAEVCECDLSFMDIS